MLQPPVGFDSGVLEILIEALYRRHDALRLRFEPGTQGWQAEHVALDEAMVRASCVCEELPRAEARRAFLSERCTHWQGSFDLQHGPLLRAVYFAAPQAQDSRVLLIVHHIVVDGVSWRVLLTDLERAYRQHVRGERIDLGAKSSSYQQWGEALQEYACSESLRAQKGYWLAQSAPSVPLPVDRGSAGWGTIGTTRTVAVSLSAPETQALQQQCSRAYRTQINELLLAGVYLGMRQWTGESGLRLRLEGHGREELFERLDLTQTVGWFTSIYPLKLQSVSAEVGEVIKAVKEQYRSIPQHGVGYGILRYLSGDAELMAAADNNEPQLEFNYLGQFDQVLNEDTAFQAAPEGTGPQVSLLRQRSRQLALNGKVFGGQLHFVLGYSSEQYEAATMQALAGYLGAGLRRVIEHCHQRERVSYTPSDFPLARVDQQQLEEWQARYPNLVRLYPATPMQAGLLFESLLEPSTYVVQTSMRLKGGLEVAAFRRAWQQVIERHDILRTAFVGAGEQLQQLVCAQAIVPWHQQDWQGLSEAEQVQRFEQYRSQDRQAGFDFAQPPLLRLAVFRLGEERYQLLWTLHHILLDGWCLPLVYRDVITLYQAQLEGRAAVLSAAPVYEQYIGWLQRQDRLAAQAHWRELLGEMQAPTPLVVDRLPTAGSGHREQSLSLSVEQTEALQSVAQAHHTTVNTLLQWAWGYLLHRYSGEAEVVFGATVSGRPAEVAGIEEMLGLFINTLPVKIGFTGALEMTRSLHTLHESFQRSTQHGYLSLSEIQRQSRVPTGTTLFDSLLVFENYPHDPLENIASRPAGLAMERAGNHERTHYKLTLVASLGRTLRIKCGYRAEHFTEAAIQSLLAHLNRILGELPAAVRQNYRIELLSDVERLQLTSWSATDAQFPAPCIHELFEAQVQRTPDAVAVTYEGSQLTYAQLNGKANQLARDLRAQGVATGELVGICVERGVEMIVGLLGILKAGAAYVPLDPSSPRERLAYLLADAAPRVLLTQEHLLSALPSSPAQHIALDSEWSRIGGLADHDLALNGVQPADLAYVIYTSGSTGQPKGVMVEHANVTRLFAASQSHFQFDARDVWTLFHSFAFDFSVWEIWGALLYGGRLVVVPHWTLRSPEAFYRLLCDEGVTVLNQTPSAFTQLIAAQEDSKEQRAHSLRLVIFGGEALDWRALRRWVVRNGAQRPALINMYGITETTVHVTYRALSQEEIESQDGSAIGRPLADLRIYLLDQYQQPVPVGVPGEIYVGGTGVARGYLNRPELTAGRFLTDPFSSDPQARIYKSGDVGRWCASGEIEYLGRNDAQVKIRGYRIELGEIESVLAGCEGVEGAVVMVRGEADAKRIVAYVVSAAAQMSGSESPETVVTRLLQALQQQLPDYMVPTAIVVLERLPLNANGKVDRRALPEPHSPVPLEQALPQTVSEQRIAAIWGGILKVERIGIDTSFFELGGHSLLAARMLSELRSHFDIDIPIREVFTRTTVRALARYIDESMLQATLKEELALDPADSSEWVEL
jgi:amino acid adenylation domain-containing protein/non-ribosomal peptide synthase protein (TIGR01720 family)